LSHRELARAPLPLRARIDGLDWVALAQALDSAGHAVIPALLTPELCHALQASYAHDELFRSRVVMGRHGFGRGEYKYFAYPLPPLLAELRAALYPGLVPVANRWNEMLRKDVRFPESHTEYLRRCHEAGQDRPTPLLLRYTAGDYNCLHQDLYGEHVFPLQVAVLLSRPGCDFEGGELVMTEAQAGEQRADVVPLAQGDAVIFTVHQRPVQGRRSQRRAEMRHGVSRVRSGLRYTVGLIFHDAR
jgi:uncharacterized protein